MLSPDSRYEDRSGPVIVTLPVALSTEVEIFCEPVICKSGVALPKFNTAPVESSPTTLSLAYVIPPPPTPVIGIPPGVTPSEILRVRSPLGSAS